MNGLVDQFGRTHTYLRISVTDRCNLRCVYCMPAGGIVTKPKDEILTFDEIDRIVHVFARLGITKIRLTGGEPLVRKDLTSLVARLARIPGIQKLGMTTNGVLLKQHALALKESGLTALNISLDTLRHGRFEQIALRSHYEDVFTGIQAALSAGFSPLKLNVVVMGGVNDDELLDFVEFVRDLPVNVRFIEYMPFKFNSWNTASFVSFARMKQTIEARYVLIPLEVEKGVAAVAKDFRIDGWVGSVSFITSMSEHFCDTCNRLRLTADGSIKSCLFHPSEVNLRYAIRNGGPEEIVEDMIRSAVILKPSGHAPVEQLVAADNRAMIAIGG